MFQIGPYLSYSGIIYLHQKQTRNNIADGK
jgi:hypothetical protein